MKIAIINNCVPFVYGGAEMLADGLRARLVEYGHEAMVLRFPFVWNPASRILDHMLSSRLLRLENIDRVVALKFPAYYIEHPNKVLWLVHQFRQAYDLWDTPYQSIPKTPEGLRIRDAIAGCDNRFLGKIKRRYTISRLVSERLRKFNKLSSKVLYPPINNHNKYQCDEYGDYVFYPSRIVRSKRQDLAIESMKHVKTGVKLVIAGNPDSREELDWIASAVRTNNVEGRVRIIPKWISEDEKIRFFAQSLGCLFIPHAEDYGYVPLEAFYSRKAVITCTDSGGPLEFVDNKMNGFAVDPEPKEIAEAIDSLYLDKSMARDMGEAGYDKIRAMKISWERVVRILTE